jgi:uncharacterized delta-60 repeat protein
MKKILLLVFTFLAVLQLHAQEGTIDTTFRRDGLLFTPEGKLVSFLTSDFRLFMQRYNTNGTPDASFGNNPQGRVITGFGGKDMVGIVETLNPISVAIQKDGKIVIGANVSTRTSATSYNYYLSFARYNTDGTRDSSFGINGEVDTLNGASPGAPTRVLQKIFLSNTNEIIFTTLNRFGNSTVYSINRLSSSGVPENPLFFSGPSYASSTDQRIPSSIVSTPDGKFLIGGGQTGSSNILLLARDKNDGTPDSTFSTNGYAASNASTNITNLVIQDDGKILASSSDKLLRFNEDGSFDATFGNKGIVSVGFSINKTVLQPGGKIIVGGTLNGDFAIARYNTNGTIDRTFGNGGITTTDFGGNEGITDMVVVDQRIYAYGTGIVAVYKLGTCTPPTFVNNALIILDATCGNKDGNVNIIPTSGTAPSMYSIDGGVTYVSGPSTGYGFQGLAAGTYKLRLKDANGCESAVVERTVQALNCGPVITSIAPTSGPVGTTVAITGTGFDPVAANNIVYFGAVKATVVSATPTTLTVQAPAGSTYRPITVTRNGRTASLLQPFMVTCPAAGFSFSLNEKTDIAGVGNIDIVDWDGDGKADMIRGATILRNTSSGSNISFVESMTMPVGGKYAIGDVDGDGRLDLAIINAAKSTVAIFRNTSSVGNISFASAVEVPTGLYPQSVAIGDLDGDGRQDLVVAKGGTTTIFRNLSSPGNIAFVLSTEVPARNQANESVAIGDLDGDGKADLAVVHENTAISVFRNTSSYGNISFATRVDLPANLAQNLHLVDLDGDNKLDIVAINDVFVTLYPNTSSTATISFAPPVNFGAGGIQKYPTDIAIGDVNGDGLPDLAVTYGGYDDRLVYPGSTQPAYRTVNLYLNKNTINIASQGNVLVPQEPWKLDDFAAYVASGDLNGDGKSDLITTSGNTQMTSIFRNLVSCSSTCTPPTFKNDALIILDATCANNDGNINIIPTSGTAPFMYSINGGATYVAGPNTGYGFQNLTSGTYKLRLKDANGCESAIVERQVKLVCNACTPPTFVNNNLIVLDASCGKSDGAINIIPTSGTAPFMYSINGGTTYVAGPNGGYGFQNLPAGTYQLRLKDSRGCESAIVERTVRNYYNCPGITGSASRFEGALALSNKDVIATYPNPNKGQFKLLLQNFLSPKAEVSVYDAKGTLLQKRSLNLTQNTIADFDLKGKAPGLYLIKVASSNGTKVSKVLIQ